VTAAVVDVGKCIEDVGKCIEDVGNESFGKEIRTISTTFDGAFSAERSVRYRSILAAKAHSSRSSRACIPMHSHFSQQKLNFKKTNCINKHKTYNI
jgi:hypothetical protein